MMNNSFFSFLSNSEKEKFLILFEDKTTWYQNNEKSDKNWENSKSKIEKFDESLIEFIGMQQKDTFNTLELAGIKFPKLKSNNLYLYINNLINTDIKEISFWECYFYAPLEIKETTIKHNLHFGKATFNEKVNFNKSTFKKRVDFLETKFLKDVTFGGVKFLNESHFWRSTFQENMNFYSMEAIKHISFKETRFNKINFDNAIFETANFIGLGGYSEDSGDSATPLSADNFSNKESARLIKEHFEKQNNITEANKYFIIEQEKYIEELRDKNNTIEDKKLTKRIPLYFNKFVSNFGTDWVRATISLFIWGFVSLFLYMWIRYSFFTFPNEFYLAGEWNKSSIASTFSLFVLSIMAYILVYYYNNISTRVEKYFGIILILVVIIVCCYYDSNLFNLISKLINPINAFKDDDTFKGYEAFGAIVRIISATIIYQIILSFRQFTRRS